MSKDGSGAPRRGNAIDPRGRPVFLERFIHSEIYKGGREGGRDQLGRARPHLEPVEDAGRGRSGEVRGGRFKARPAVEAAAPDQALARGSSHPTIVW